jgi:argininosuccinate lyase
MPEMKLLDAPENKGQGGLSSGNAVAHETLEAYLTATGMSFNDAHARAGSVAEIAFELLFSSGSSITLRESYS